MGLEDDLKARTSALISQQMANWVVEIQRAIQGHQAALVNALDELGETVARYDEKIDEGAIAQAIAEVVAQQPPVAAAPDYSGLKSAITAIEKGTNLSEVLTHLMDEVTRHVERAAMFIVKNNAAIGWYARGFDHSEAVKARQHPAHRRHGVPPRPRLAQRHARPRQPLPRDRPGARTARRRAAGAAGGAADPARQGGGDPLLRHDAGRDVRRHAPTSSRSWSRTPAR